MTSAEKSVWSVYVCRSPDRKPCIPLAYQLLACDEAECGVEISHRHNQRVDRAAILEVAHKCDGEIFESALGLVDRVEVKHRLRGMLVGTVTGIDYGYVGYLSGIEGRSFKEMTHHYEVGIIAHHLDGVLERLAFGGGGVGGI